jgi:hypothetical protein
MRRATLLRLFGRLLGGAVIAASLGAAAIAAEPNASSGTDEARARAFATPEDAAGALSIALATDDVDLLLDIFGPELDDVVLGADPTSARLTRYRAAAALQEKLTLRRDGADQVTLLLGRNAWPMPIPLVRTEKGWSFDGSSGVEEILLRRIGQNEIAAIEALRAFVRAQNDYAARSHRKGRAVQYARYVQSTPGKTDGLWWDKATAAQAGPSPLESFVAKHRAFLEARDPGDPFHGYYFRVLQGQGPHAPGGARSYVVEGRMADGFALLAWPADYGSSGIMTFMVDKSGRVLEKDLGEDSAAMVQTIRIYDPDESWGPAD